MIQTFTLTSEEKRVDGIEQHINCQQVMMEKLSVHKMGCLKFNNGNKQRKKVPCDIQAQLWSRRLV